MIFCRTALVLLGFVVIVSEVNASDLSSYGLESLVVQSDAAGDEVRGMSASSGYSGLSLVSGVLFDPGTGSTATVSSINRSASRSDGVGTSVNSMGQTAAGVNYNWDVNGLRQQISGFALGFGVASVGFR